MSEPKHYTHLMKCWMCKAKKNKNGSLIKWNECTPCHSKRMTKYNKANRIKIWETIKKWRIKNPEKVKASNKRSRDKARLEVIQAYGGKSPKCVCCGEKEILFLVIDHIFNDGAIERKSKKMGSGSAFYFNLRKRGFPKGRYQILCHNCNAVKAFIKFCPHRIAKKRAAIPDAYL